MMKRSSSTIPFGYRLKEDNTLEPIDMSKYTKDTIDQLVDETYEKMSKVYKELTASIK